MKLIRYWDDCLATYHFKLVDGNDIDNLTDEPYVVADGGVGWADRIAKHYKIDIVDEIV
jgi:hypothetical protein